VEGWPSFWHVPLTKKLKIKEEKRVQQEGSGKKTPERSYPREKEKNRENEEIRRTQIQEK